MFYEDIRQIDIYFFYYWMSKYFLIKFVTNMPSN